MKFVIFKVKNGYLLNIYRGKITESYIYTIYERMTMFAHIDKILGEEPDDSTGMELKELA